MCVSLCFSLSWDVCVFVCVSLMKAKQKGNTSKQQSAGASPATDLNQQSNSLVSLKQKSTIGKCQVLHPGWSEVCAFLENARNKPSTDGCSTMVLKGGNVKNLCWVWKKLNASKKIPPPKNLIWTKRRFAFYLSTKSQ